MDSNEAIEEIENEEVMGNPIIEVLSLVSTWFIRIGMVIAIILFLYFVIHGEIFHSLLYVAFLIVAYFFGYFFMLLLDKFVSIE